MRIRKNVFYLPDALVVCMIITFLAAPDYSFAKKTDSLHNALTQKNIPDTTLVNIYAGLAWEYKNGITNIDSIFYYANKGMAIANTINYGPGKALCHMHLGIAYMLRHEYGPALQNLNDALPYFKRSHHKKELNETLHTIGLIYNLQVKYDLAIKYFTESKEVAASIKNLSRLARAHFYLAGIENDKGDFTNALKDYLQAMSLYEQTGNKNNVTNCITNIAILYAELKDYKKAREYIEKSLAIVKEFRNPREALSNLSNIAIVYSMMGEYENALELFSRGLHIADSTEDDYWGTVFLTNIAEVYANTGKWKEALDIYNQMLKRNEKLDDLTVTVFAHSGIGRILHRQGRKEEGTKHMLESFRIAKENGMKVVAMESAGELTAVFEKDGDFKKALEYSRIRNEYKDSIYNESNDKKIQQLQFDYELEKKQRQIEQLGKNKEIEKEKTDKQGLISWSLAGAMVLLCVIIFIMYRKRVIEKQNREEILKQNKEIQLQSAKLEELNGFKDKTFSVLSHDLRGPINSITAAIQLLNEKQITPEEYAEIKPEINNQLSSLNLLLDNVLLWAKSHIQEEGAARPARTSLYDLAGQNVALLTDAATRKQLTLKNEVDRSAIAFCDAGQMDIVLRNLIMNAIKYTGNGGTITVSTDTNTDAVRMSVTDSGVGMRPEQIAGLFTAKAGRNTYGTAGETGIGLGLLLCQGFVKANNGTITVNSEPGKGSTFTVTLPLA